MVATDTAAIAAVTAAAAAAAAAATTTATNSTTLGANSTSGIGADGPLVAPRPVPAHQLNPPSWLFAALPLDVLFGLAAAPNHKQKIINDVFLTPEEHHTSPQLTPVSYIEDTRMRPL
ncbi:hypothetical protein EV177_010923, partial [Coemansia sp. RSA 1804]